MKIKISNKWIGEDSPVFVIAEAGINHNGNIKIAKRMIRAAKKVSVDAIKFQTFRASDFVSIDSKYYKIFKKLELDEYQFGELSDYAKSNGIMFLSTPFSTNAVDILLKLNVPAFKIASGDLTNIPLIKYAASKKKPMIISTGMANMNEVQTAVKSIHATGNNKIIIMHSVSAYPTPHNETNLRTIEQIYRKFGYPVGYSDNGSDLLVPLISVAIGAKIIEKHFTLNKKMIGPDHSLSTEPKQFKVLVHNIRYVEQMLGDGIKCCQPSELHNKIHARRSITAKVNIEKGTILKPEMLELKRPAYGIEPFYFNKIIGRITLKQIKINKSLKWGDIK